MAQAPFEIIGNPAQIYMAPVGTAFPLLDVAPAVAWKLLGLLGSRNTSNDGVKVEHKQKIELVRPDGATGPVKAFRSEEDLIFEITLWDLTMEAYAYALNEIAPTTVAAGAGTVGQKNLPLGRGSDVQQFAALMRWPSPYLDLHNAQYEVPVVVNIGDATVVYKKATPAGLMLRWQALEDPTASGDNRYGTLRAAHAAELP